MDNAKDSKSNTLHLAFLEYIREQRSLELARTAELPAQQDAFPSTNPAEELAQLTIRMGVQMRVARTALRPPVYRPGRRTYAFGSLNQKAA